MPIIAGHAERDDDLRVCDPAQGVSCFRQGIVCRAVTDREKSVEVACIEASWSAV